jgi:uncharacterized coiled-coil protein SlyX
MDVAPDDASTWLKTIIAVLVGLWTWSLHRLVGQLDEQKKDIAKLKEDVAGRAKTDDIVAVYARLNLVDERIGERLTTLTDRINDNHVETLEAIYNRNTKPPHGL